MKKSYKLYFLYTIIAISLLVGLYMLAQPNIISQTEQSTDDYTVNTKVYECGWLCNLFKQDVQQTVFFNTGEFTAATLYRPTYNVGVPVTFYSRMACENYASPAQTKQDATISTFVGLDTASVLSPTNSQKVTNIANHVSTYVTHTATFWSAGTYKAWDKIICYDPGKTAITYTQDSTGLTRRFNIVSAPAACSADKLVRTSSGIDDAIGYSNAIIDCEEWSHYSGTSCVGSAVYKNCKTTCKSNAYCDSSYSSTSCDGKISCVLKPAPECTTDKTTTCADGSKVTTKACQDGKYVATGNVCINAPPVESCSDGIQNQIETGIDCGGSCSACAVTSCSDGIQNGIETGIDCGGSCSACTQPSCTTSTDCQKNTCDTKDAVCLSGKCSFINN